MSFANEKQEVLVNRENGGGEERKIAEKIFTKRKRMLEWKEKEEKEGSVVALILNCWRKFPCDNSLFFADSFARSRFEREKLIKCDDVDVRVLFVIYIV